MNSVLGRTQILVKCCSYKWKLLHAYELLFFDQVTLLWWHCLKCLYIHRKQQSRQKWLLQFNKCIYIFIIDMDSSCGILTEWLNAYIVRCKYKFSVKWIEIFHQIHYQNSQIKWSLFSPKQVPHWLDQEYSIFKGHLLPLMD